MATDGCCAVDEVSGWVYRGCESVLMHSWALVHLVSVAPYIEHAAVFEDLQTVHPFQPVAKSTRTSRLTEILGSPPSAFATRD